MLFIMVGCFFGALLGSVFFSILFVDWAEIPKRLSAMDFIGRTVIGGIGGGYLAVEVTKKWVNYPYSTGDAFALAIPLGHAIGRMGCFLGGCCYGTVSHLPWAIEYPVGSVPFLSQVKSGMLSAQASHSLAVHPAPLYDLFFDLCLFVWLFVKRDSFQTRGALFRVYLFAYASFRFIAEFFRADTPFPVVGGPKPVQIFLLLVALYYGVWLWRHERKTP